MANAMERVQESPLLVSNYFSKVEYIPLETTDSSLVGLAPHVVITKDIMVVSSLNQPLKIFDRHTGDYITNVGSIGQGPKEYAKGGWGEVYFWVDCDEELIYVKGWENDFMVYDKGGNIESIIRPALYITESKKIGELLQELQHKKSHIAIVLDEYGGTTGIVTLEDILEELVGEIWDEHDEVINEIEKVSETEYIVHGSTNLEDLFEVLDMGMKIDEEVEEMEVVTVSGWVMEEVLERIPAKGDVGTWQNLEVTVLEMDENRVEKIKLVINEEAASEE